MALFYSKPKPTPAQTEKPRPEPQTKAENSTIQVSEIDNQFPPWVVDAVIQFATGRAEEAAAALNRHLLEYPDEPNMMPWLMLFDIHEANRQQTLFEDLALDFAVKFERSPPAWTPVDDDAAAAPGQTLKFAFGQTFSAVDKARVQHFLLETAGAASVCLDFSQTPAPPPPYAKVILECIQRLRREDKAITVVGGPAFIVRLNAACKSHQGNELGWLLLLAMEELLGDPNGFEEVALAFAIRFEISPPSYVAPKPPPEGSEAQAAEPISPDTIALDAPINLKAADQLRALSDFATGRTRMEVDMSRVPSIDFASTGQVLDTLIHISEGGCRVTLKDCNSLVLALLQIIGADQFATLTPRKRI